MGKDVYKPSYEDLLDINRELRSRIRAMCQRVEMLEQQNLVLQAALEESQKEVEKLRRAKKRQAAPFQRRKSRRKSESQKNRPGRQEGHKGACRPEPEPDRVDEEKCVELTECPHCGGPVSHVQPLVQYIEDIPPLRTHTLRLITHSGYCARCGCRVRSKAPEQVSEATGAAGTHLGRNALALAVHLRFVMGMTYRKMAGLLKLFGLKVTPGGLVHVVCRSARKLAPVWDEIWGEIRAGPWACTDETSWYVGEPGWWLWVFCDRDWTLYVVDASRGSEVVERMLPGYAGVQVSDCLSTYDPADCRKQKCYAHHLKALSQACEDLPPESQGPLRDVRMMLRAAMALGKLRGEIEPGEYARRRASLERVADRLLDAHYSEPGVEKALGRFRRHREHLFTFLYEEGVPATNNLAERQLRPAVVTRKISCGNRGERGRRAWEILASVAATCAQQGKSLHRFVYQAMGLHAPAPQLKAA